MYRNHLFLFLNLILSVVILGFSPSGVARAVDIGILGLYSLHDGESPVEVLGRLGSELADRGCSLRRQGRIDGTNGPLTLPDVERFVVVECKTSLLESAGGRAALQRFENTAKSAGKARTVVWLEGVLTQSEGLAAETNPDRAYTIKLSRYTDGASAIRDREVAAISEDASRRRNAFRNEAVIAVSRTTGIDALDEVTLLYYAGPVEAKAFREANGDLLKRIGAFNKAHLTDYVYLRVSAEP